MVNFLMSQVTKVFLPASYVLCNGALVAPTGSSMIACVAHKNQIPVIVVCETYKFEDRVNLDQINHNRELVPHKFQDNYLRKICQNKSQLDEIKVETMVTACSNCRTVLEDGLDANDMDMEVLGLTELIADHLVEDEVLVAS